MLKLEHQIAYPAQRRYTTPLLLVHGAWHGAWCWHAAMEDFAARGFEVHAVSLRGHGTSDRPRSFNFCGMADYVRDIETAIASIHPRPVVVAHSMGAYVLQLLVTGRGTPSPDADADMRGGQVAGVALVGSPPPNGILPFLLRYARRYPLALARTALTANLRHMVGSPRLVRELFLRSGADDDQANEVAARVSSEALRVAIEMAVLIKPEPAANRAPLLVIGAEQDRVFGPQEQHDLAQAYDAPLLMIPDAGHDIMLDQNWSLAAEAIERFAASSGARTARRRMTT